jgi:hypothetical protein
MIFEHKIQCYAYMVVIGQGCTGTVKCLTKPPKLILNSNTHISMLTYLNDKQNDRVLRVEMHWVDSLKHTRLRRSLDGRSRRSARRTCY